MKYFSENFTLDNQKCSCRFLLITILFFCKKLLEVGKTITVNLWWEVRKRKIAEKIALGRKFCFFRTIVTSNILWQRFCSWQNSGTWMGDYYYVPATYHNNFSLVSESGWGYTGIYVTVRIQRKKNSYVLWQRARKQFSSSRLVRLMLSDSLL